jgi:hypothetical protein
MDLCGAKRKGDGGFAFPAADFDDDTFLVVEVA